MVRDAFVIKSIKPEKFKSSLAEVVLNDIQRRGKALIITLSNGYFWVVQPMMTGQLVYVAPTQKPEILKETHVVIALKEGGHLLYNDQRKFGHLRLVKDITTINYFNIIGPEPLTNNFTPAHLAASLKKSERDIKNILLDHTVVAGIGNIYAAEILYRAHVSPKRPGSTIKAIEVDNVFKEIRAVLKQAIEHRGSSMRNYRDGLGLKGEFNKLIQVYAREGEPCGVCRKPIERIVQSGRSTFYCIKCQK